MIRTFIAILFIAASAFGQDPARMDQAVQSYVPNKQFMGSVLVARSTEVLLSKGYGWANVEWEVPNTPTTKFRLGSITKQFTAASILLLEERGKLKTGDPIKKYFPAPGAAGPVNAGYVDMTVPHGAGALYSTVEDLLRWEQGLFGGKVLSPASLQKMTTPYKSDYAFGLLVRTVNGRKVIEHNGGIQGFNTSLSYYPDSKVTVAVLGNLNGRIPEEIAGKLARLAHGETIQLTSERKEIKVAPEVLKQYVGTYEARPGLNLMITIEGDQLMGQLSGQGRIPHFAESETRFFLKVVDAQVEFFKDGNGKVTHAVLYQNGREMKFNRLSDTVQQRKEITVSTDILARYPGTYELLPGFDLTVSLEGNQLMAQATGQGRFPIFPESETNFFAKVADIQIEFREDAGGKVNELVLKQGPVPARTAKKK